MCQHVLTSPGPSPEGLNFLTWNDRMGPDPDLLVLGIFGRLDCTKFLTKDAVARGFNPGEEDKQDP